MDGILYLTDENNNKKYIQIDLNKYGSIVEDVLDRITVESRKNEKSYPIEDIMEELIAKGNLAKYV